MSNTRFLLQMAIIGLMSVLATTTFAQGQPQEGGRQRGGPGRGFGGGGFGGGGFGAPQIDRATLLRNDKVRQELKIEEAQAATIDSAIEAYREERSATPFDREAFGKLTEEERAKFFEDAQKKREELSKKTDEVLTALLDDTQGKRLDEISLQVRMSLSASGTLKADDVKKKLAVTDEQIAKIDEAEKTANEERQKMFAELFAGGGGRPPRGEAPAATPGAAPGGNREAMREKMDEMRKKSTEATLAVLTDEQKQTLEGLKGAAFEINPMELFGRPGGGFGGPPGQGGGRPRGGRPPVE